MTRRAATKRRNTTTSRDDQAWIRQHFEELVDKYRGQYAVVAAGELFVGYDPVLLETEARKKHPGVMPSVLRVPRPEDFTCAL
jgi:hypothetical protein